MKELKIQDLFQISKGKKVEQIANDSKDKIRYIQIEDLRNNETIKYCKNDNKYIYASKDDIIIAWDGANAGTIGYNIEGAIGSTLAVLKRKNNDFAFNTAYVAKFMQSKTRFLRDNCTGATIPHISRKVLENLNVPLPSMDVQNKIVILLDKVQSLIDKRKAQIAALSVLTHSVFLEMFGDPHLNNKNWPIVKIGDLTIKSQYGTSKKASEFTGKYPILRMNNISYDGRVSMEDLKYIDLDEKEAKKYLVHKGDLLFNRTNSKELVGKTAVYPYDEPVAFAGYLIKLIPNDKANSVFISAYLNSLYGKKVLLNMAKNIVGMANINAEELKSINIYLPPIELQNEFANIIENIEEKRNILNQSLIQLENNFQSLMQRVFRG